MTLQTCWSQVSMVDSELKSKEDFIKALKGYANQRKNSFYIGVAQCPEGATSADALKEREKSGHHIDKQVGRKPDKKFRSYPLLKQQACAMEGELINEYIEYSKCLNSVNNSDNCINTDKGIVYMRIYLDENSPTSSKSH